ncbi:NAD(P)-binding domain-containing protein [Leifsonia kafniensis]|uniref:NAD(P)-binding domain-containing protein n=1 Tax=Leifsonia kafniensis TaxID=475957 RepID=A0ABP7KR34_9MICO
MATVGILGAGHVGSALARALIPRGYEVLLSNSRGPETLHSLAAGIGPKCRAVRASEAASLADWVIVSVPLHALEKIPVDELSGKIVLDTINYYPDRDGRVRALDRAEVSTSELVQRHLPGASVVKAFNHMRAQDVLLQGRSSDSARRWALVAAGDDPLAVGLVCELYDELGFDSVVIDSLAESWRIESDQPAYQRLEGASKLREELALASRASRFASDTLT